MLNINISAYFGVKEFTKLSSGHYSVYYIFTFVA